MANDEFRKARPHIQLELSPSDARSETRLPRADDNRFQRPDHVRNPRALTAWWLGVFSLILSGGWLMTMMMSLSNQPASFRLGITTVMGPLQLVLGLTGLVFGILGLKSIYKHPTLGGFSDSVIGIVMGVLTILFGLFLCYCIVSSGIVAYK